MVENSTGFTRKSSNRITVNKHEPDADWCLHEGKKGAGVMQFKSAGLMERDIDSKEGNRVLAIL